MVSFKRYKKLPGFSIKLQTSVISKHNLDKTTAPTSFVNKIFCLHTLNLFKSLLFLVLINQLHHTQHLAKKCGCYVGSMYVPFTQTFVFSACLLHICFWGIKKNPLNVSLFLPNHLPSSAKSSSLPLYPTIFQTHSILFY